MRALLLVALVALVACGCHAAARRPDAVLRITTPVAAQLYVDDRFVGSAARPVGLRAGLHRIEVRAEGRFPAYREVTIARGHDALLDVPLRPDPDAAGAP